MAFDFSGQRAPKRISLTPMIDVVFLLLVFFMLAARFGADSEISLKAAGRDASGYQGAPRLVELRPGGITLNGTPVSREALVEALRPLMPAPDALVVLRARDGADVQGLVDVIEALQAGGITTLALAEAPE
ncbi:biopolymer transporter ExbD [Oceanicella sp. SM1341]|uniref:ExbD/TolR family protein n=1 Tax=Oceanicella sp. SM1341 TaxID=1548889 RepID=UPI001E332764|nr:biopolymer transporter ExbD [Oceanicella sp. SM1341]